MLAGPSSQQRKKVTFVTLNEFCLLIVMSSHFFKFIFKTSQYHQMKAVNEEDFRMASFRSLAASINKRFSRYVKSVFKVQKTGHF